MDALSAHLELGYTRQRLVAGDGGGSDKGMMSDSELKLLASGLHHWLFRVLSQSG